MNLWHELYLGIIIGLSWSFRSLLSNLPGNKLRFFFNCLMLYHMLGGLSYGKLKLIIGLLTFLVFRRSDHVIDLLWSPLFALASTALKGVAGGLLAVSSAMLLPERRKYATFW